MGCRPARAPSPRAMSTRLTTARRYGAAFVRVAEEAGRVGLDRFRPPGGPIPLDARELTPAALAAVTGADPGTVGSVEVLAHDRGSADRARIAVEADAGAELPPTLFLKLTPS